MIRTLHGIHTSKGSRRMASMSPVLAKASGMSVQYFEYGNTWAINSGWQNPGIAKQFAKTVRDGDVIVAHSNGNAIALRAMMAGAKPQGLVVLNGALEVDVAFPDCLKWIHVYFNQYDDAVPMAELPVLRRLVFDALWGEMGKFGYTGKDQRVVNFDCWNTDDATPLSGHSAIIDPENRNEWGTLIGKRILGAQP